MRRLSRTDLPEFVEPHLARCTGSTDAREIHATLWASVSDGEGELLPLRCAELLASRPRDEDSDVRAATEAVLLQELARRGVDTSAGLIRRTVSRFVERAEWAASELTGAEVVAVVLEQHGVGTAFAYPGTSELALCDCLESASGLRLVNGRGDKECAFLATGASLLRANTGVALLHGARGLTNAAGGIANARRNEVGTLFLAGLPSTGSAPFLPPHGEHELIPALGTFTEWWWQAPPVPEEPAERRACGERFVGQLRSALASSARLPARPSLFGIPQDVAEARWIPLSALQRPGPEQAPRIASAAALESGLDALCGAERALFLVDDYALRYPELREALARLSDHLGAPVLQLRYRRGPMLFERLRNDEVGNFLGWLNPFSSVHQEWMAHCDVLVTVEDRNMYRRVVGDLPPCRKIAINGDAEKVRKNQYLGDGDVLLEGHVTQILRTLLTGLAQRRGGSKPWFDLPSSPASRVTPEPAGEEVEYLRTRVTQAIAEILSSEDEPVLVDDSQMFGGLLSERYELLPRGLRVFGDHAGFVGGGLGTAIGLAIAEPRRLVLCTLGDQGFVNSFQALVAASQESARLIVVVCNNGESVSLKKQAAASDRGRPGRSSRRYLDNVPGLSYPRIAEALAVPAWSVEVPPRPKRTVDRAVRELRRALAEAVQASGPALVELRLPSDPEVWRGVWLTQGFEQRAADPPRAHRA